MSDEASLKVCVNDEVYLYTNSKQTLLECLEEKNVTLHYHCRDGFCGACRVTLTQGDIHYPKGEPLAFVGENEILPCCCAPISDITLTIDH